MVRHRTSTGALLDCGANATVVAFALPQWGAVPLQFNGNLSLSLLVGIRNV
jgi:hypothetical protein